MTVYDAQLLASLAATTKKTTHQRARCNCVTVRKREALHATISIVSTPDKTIYEVVSFAWRDDGYDRELPCFDDHHVCDVSGSQFPSFRVPTSSFLVKLEKE